MTAIRVRNRDDLLTVMRKARETLGFTHLEMDERVGLGSGHYGKIERMGTGWGKEAFRYSPSVANCLDLLGLELVIAPKGEVPAEIIPRDVRLPPSATVVQLFPQPMSDRPKPPGQVETFRARARAKLQAQVEKGQKKAAQRRAGRLKAGGATC
jgi:hypothetical protein